MADIQKNPQEPAPVVPLQTSLINPVPHFKKNRSRTLLVILAILVFLAGAVFYLVYQKRNSASKDGQQKIVDKKTPPVSQQQIEKDAILNKAEIKVPLASSTQPAALASLPKEVAAIVPEGLLDSPQVKTASLAGGGEGYLISGNAQKDVYNSFRTISSQRFDKLQWTVVETRRTEKVAYIGLSSKSWQAQVTISANGNAQTSFIEYSFSPIK